MNKGVGGLIDTASRRVLSKTHVPEALFGMDTTPLYVLKRPDGTFKYYVDPDYAKEQGVSADKLVCVEVPSTIYANGSVDDLSTYIAQELEKRAVT